MIEKSIIICIVQRIGLACKSMFLQKCLQNDLQDILFFCFFATVLRKTVPKPKKDRDV
jgi:hypothetical protein